MQTYNEDGPTDDNQPQRIEVAEHIDFPLIAEGTKETLQHFEELVAEDYKRFKRELFRWLLTEGKDPYRGEGYAAETIRVTHYKVEDIFRWHWEQQGEYTLTFTPAHGTELLHFLMKRTPHPDSVVKDFEKAMKRLFQYFRKEKNRELPEWDHDVPIEPSRGSQDHVKNRFYPHEMSQLYEAALKEYSVKSYHNKQMSPTERDRIKTLLSQRHGKPKDEIAPEDFSKATSWKIPSMIAVTSDTGLRPIEVARANIGWMDLGNRRMVIPKEEASKSDSNWVCQLSEKSVTALRKWKQERRTYEKYDDRDALWLTRHGNRYESRSVNYILDKLIERVGIDEQKRNLSWYSFRHGVATMWINEEGAAKAQEQLRHKNTKTTMKYSRSGDSKDTHVADGLW